MGIDQKYLMVLDVVSEGNFNTKSLEEANKLIENLTSSNNTKNAGLDRKRLAET